MFNRLRCPFIIGLNQFNTVLLVAPYQLQRRPRRPIEENCLEFARDMAQNVAEIVRSLDGCLVKVAHPWRSRFFVWGMDCGFDRVQRCTHRLCRSDCARCAKMMNET